MFDLVMNFFEGPRSLRLNLAYATDIFGRWRIEALVGHLQRVSASVVLNPSLPPVLDPPAGGGAQRAARARQRRGTGPPLAPVHTTIADVARRRPSAVAAVCRDSEMTYG